MNDFKQIRKLNGNESGVVGLWISVKEEYPKFNFEEFKESLPSKITKYDAFKYFHKENYWYMFTDDWIKTHVDSYLIKVDYKENELVRNTNKEFDRNGMIFFIEYSENIEKNISKIEVYVCHCSCDARSCFNYFTVVRNAIPGMEQIEFNNVPINEYDLATCFNLSENEINEMPESWKEIKEGRILPVYDEEDEYINETVVYDYSRIRPFCKNNHLGVQSIIDTCQARAFRKIRNLPIDHPICIWAPTDTRHSPFAKEEYSKRSFYCNNGGSFISIKGSENIIEDIIEGNKLVRKYTSNKDCCINVIRWSRNVFDPILDFTTKNILIVSNISEARHLNDPYYSLFLKLPKGGYSINFYSWHTENKVYFMYLRPKNLDSKIVDIMKEELDNIIKEIENHIKAAESK